jgi:hypothetical protein
MAGQAPRKTNWKDVGQLRKPNANWRMGKAARYLAGLLDLPEASLVFVRPHGENARSNKTLGALREEWVLYLAKRGPTRP